jgi:hypothetical protein
VEKKSFHWGSRKQGTVRDRGKKALERAGSNKEKSDLAEVASEVNRQFLFNEGCYVIFITILSVSFY